MTVTGRGYEGSSKSPISYFRKHSAPKLLGLGPGKAARLVRATRPVHLVEEVQQERNVRPLLAVSAPWNELTGIWPESVPPTSSREAGLPGAVKHDKASQGAVAKRGYAADLALRFADLALRFQ